MEQEPGTFVYRMQLVLETDKHLTDDDLRELSEAARMAVVYELMRRMEEHKWQEQSAVEVAEKIIKRKE